MFDLDNMKSETVTDRVNDGIVLTQRTKGLKFGTDALLLAAYMPEQKKPIRAAELGSGTGIISLLALQRKKAETVFAYEIQESYAQLTAFNAAQNGHTCLPRIKVLEVVEKLIDVNGGLVDDGVENLLSLKELLCSHSSTADIAV